MEWIKNGAIPQRALPLNGWAERSLPGGQAEITVRYGGSNYLKEYLEAQQEKVVLTEDKEIIEITSIIVKLGIIKT